jgi:hypothetical protein
MYLQNLFIEMVASAIVSMPDRLQMFSAAKVTQVQLLSSSHAALLSWSVSPTLARCGFYAAPFCRRNSLRSNSRIMHKSRKHTRHK